MTTYHIRMTYGESELPHNLYLDGVSADDVVTRAVTTRNPEFKSSRIIVEWTEPHSDLSMAYYRVALKTIYQCDVKWSPVRNIYRFPDSAGRCETIW